MICDDEEKPSEEVFQSKEAPEKAAGCRDSIPYESVVWDTIS